MMLSQDIGIHLFGLHPHLAMALHMKWFGDLHLRDKLHKQPDDGRRYCRSLPARLRRPSAKALPQATTA